MFGGPAQLASHPIVNPVESPTGNPLVNTTVDPIVNLIVNPVVNIEHLHHSGCNHKNHHMNVFFPGGKINNIELIN